MAFVRCILSGNNRVWVLLPAMFVAVVACGCGTNGDPASPATPGVPFMSGEAGGSAPLADEVVDAINESIQDEYYALFTYTRVVMDFGELQPFSSIKLAEARHVDALEHLFTKRGLEIPPSEWDESNVPTFVFFLDACEGGRDSELANIAMYDRLLLTPDLPSDVSNVFTNLRAASDVQHLPAFKRCINR